MSTVAEPPADHKKEETAWDLIGLAVAAAVMAGGAIVLVAMAWSDVMSYAHFGCMLGSGVFALAAAFILRLGARRNTTAHLITNERIADLSAQVGEQAADIEELAGALDRIAQASTNQVGEQRKRYHGM
jgi:hypothetical protein